MTTPHYLESLYRLILNKGIENIFMRSLQGAQNMSNHLTNYCTSNANYVYIYIKVHIIIFQFGELSWHYISFQTSFIFLFTPLQFNELDETLPLVSFQAGPSQSRA